MLYLLWLSASSPPWQNESQLQTESHTMKENGRGTQSRQHSSQPGKQLNSALIFITEFFKKEILTLQVSHWIDQSV